MKNYNVIVTVILLIFMFFTLRGCRDSKEFKAKLSVLTKANDSLGSLYLKEQKVSDSLLKIKNKTIIEYKTIYKTLKPIQDEQDNVNDIVHDLNERELDSTIRAYKHPKRN